jgi:hypothetical protein
MHIAINISNLLPVFKTTNSSDNCEFFLCQIHSFLSKSVLSYCPKMEQSQFIINSICSTIHIGSTGTDMFAAGYGNIFAQQQNGILLILQWYCHALVTTQRVLIGNWLYATLKHCNYNTLPNSCIKCPMSSLATAW